MTAGPAERPLARANLARGPRPRVVIADESRVDLAPEPVERFASRVNRASLGRSASPAGGYRYRLLATIALAEIARQVGTRASRGPRRRPTAWDRSLRLLEETRGETWSLSDLRAHGPGPAVTLAEWEFHSHSARSRLRPGSAAY